MVGNANIHDMPEEEFAATADALDAAGIIVPEFGSAIGNWGKKISSDFDITIAEIERAIPRMKRAKHSHDSNHVLRAGNMGTGSK